MNIAVIGLGVQGKKRKAFLGNSCTVTVDPISSMAKYKSIEQVPQNSFDAAFVCTPDSVKLKIIEYLIKNRKHVLCEKPLSFTKSTDFDDFEAKANQNQVLLYTAYNHNFEQSINDAKKLIDKKFLGEIYQVRIFYGNGTARVVSNSSWRDSGLGVISDLGSHCISMIKYWFPDLEFSLKLGSYDSFETISPDSSILISTNTSPRIFIDVTLCSWKNTFRAEITGENGVINIHGLNKWGESKLIIQKRILPSGIPSEDISVYKAGDKTWQLEHDHFLFSVKHKLPTNLAIDKFIFNTLNSISLGKA